MFDVTLSQLIVIFLFLILGGLFILWIVGEIGQSRRARQLRRFQIVCQVCGVRYEDRSEEPLPRCPYCDRANERDEVQEI